MKLDQLRREFEAAVDALDDDGPIIIEPSVLAHLTDLLDQILELETDERISHLQ